MKQLFAVGVALLLLATADMALAQQGGARTIAVAATGKVASASVSNQAGRSPFFLFFDSKGTLMEAVGNPHKDEGNAGIATLDFLASKGAKVVVAESFGSKIAEVMKDKGLRPMEFKGTAADAVKKAMELK